MFDLFCDLYQQQRLSIPRSRIAQRLPVPALCRYSNKARNCSAPLSGMLRRMQEADIDIDAKDARLSGTLCLPEGVGPFPVVLMLPGSGPIDRNENLEGQRLDVFNTLAHHLSQSGIASLRYDKRGCGRSTGSYFKARYSDFVADAIACLDTLRRDSNMRHDRLFALGHSEGTLTAMHLSLERPMLSGIIQLCPTAENFEDALMKQAYHLRTALGSLPDGSDPVEHQRRLIERVKSHEAAPEEVEAHGIGLPWLLEGLGLSIPGLYQQMRVPMLLVAGSKDLHCDPTMVASLAQQTTTPMEIHIIEDLTHMLRLDDEEPSLLRYPALLQKPVSSEVLTLISGWLSRQPTTPAISFR